jgi:hypothetical protein
MTAQHQLRLRVTLPRDLHARFDELPPALRSQAAATMLVAAADGVDLHRLIAAVEQLRRAGVLLNQALHYAYLNGNFDAASAAAVVDFIQRLRGRP